MSEPLNEKERRILTTPGWDPTRPVSPPECHRPDCEGGHCKHRAEAITRGESPPESRSMMRRKNVMEGRPMNEGISVSPPEPLATCHCQHVRGEGCIFAARAQDETACPDCERTHPWRDHSDPDVETRAQDETGPKDDTGAEERLLDAVRAYGDARADVAYGRATRKAIDLAWDRLLVAARIPPMDQRGGAEERLRAAARDALTVMEEAWPDRPATLNLRSALSGGSVDEETR